jgi:hypothetical protein
MTYSPGANLYGIGVGSRPENVEVPHYDTRAPTTYDTNYPLGKQWVWPNNGVWSLNYLLSTNNVLAATWVQLVNGTGDLLAVVGTTNQIVATPNTPSSGTTTLTIPGTFSAPGSVSVGTKLFITTGTNASAGQTGAMTGGTITVATTAVTANSLIYLTVGVPGGTVGSPYVSSVATGTSFTISSTSTLDTSKVNWLIIN